VLKYCGKNIILTGIM